MALKCRREEDFFATVRLYFRIFSMQHSLQCHPVKVERSERGVPDAREEYISIHPTVGAAAGTSLLGFLHLPQS